MPVLWSEAVIPITERDFQKTVLDMARFFGWKDYFSWSSLHSPRGFPDLVLARERDGVVRLVFVELKSEKGKLTEAQCEWLDLLAKVPGVEAHCFKPSDWSQIEGTLR